MYICFLSLALLAVSIFDIRHNGLVAQLLLIHHKSYVNCLLYVPVAQLVEHLTFNQRVVGSNPAGHTTSKILIKKAFELYVGAVC